MKDIIDKVKGEYIYPGTFVRALGGPTNPSGLPWDKRIIRYPIFIARIDDIIYMREGNLSDRQLWKAGSLNSDFDLILNDDVKYVIVRNKDGEDCWEAVYEK